MHRLHCSPTMIIHGVGGGRSIVVRWILSSGGLCVYCRLHLALSAPGRTLLGVWKTRCTLERGCAPVKIPLGRRLILEHGRNGESTPVKIGLAGICSSPFKAPRGICSSPPTQEEVPATKGRERRMEAESLRESYTKISRHKGIKTRPVNYGR